MFFWVVWAATVVGFVASVSPPTEFGGSLEFEGGGVVPLDRRKGAASGLSALSVVWLSSLKNLCLTGDFSIFARFGSFLLDKQL